MSEEHAYAYEAGYRDGSIHYELEHCPSCQNIADLQEALEENAKLRECVTRLVQAKTRVYDYDDGPDYQLCVEQKWLTAEEAVRVALGIKPQEVLERRIDELCAEVEAEKQRNAKLFKAAEKWMAKAAHFEAENAKLRDENAELRKLGGFMLRCISQYHDCADCLVNGEHCEISYIESDARELGIVQEDR